MQAHDVIESYITDVAVRLPRRQRNDVAFELRALLHEELQARADAAGRAPDAAMAMELLRAFGMPAEVAARYRPQLTIIDPSDGRRFLLACAIGLAVIWLLGLVEHLRPPFPGDSWLWALGQWWTGVVIPSLWWPGVLVAGFGLAAWSRRRESRSFRWKPRANDRIGGGRIGLVLGIAGIACGLWLVSEPQRVLDVFFPGTAAPAAYEALTYTDAFRSRQAPLLWALVALNIPILLAAWWQGRWPAPLRRISTALSLAVCAAILWAVLDGPVMMTAAGNQTMKTLLALIVVFTLAGYAIGHYRGVRPAPGH